MTTVFCYFKSEFFWVLIALVVWIDWCFVLGFWFIVDLIYLGV